LVLSPQQEDLEVHITSPHLQCKNRNKGKGSEEGYTLFRGKGLPNFRISFFYNLRSKDNFDVITKVENFVPEFSAW
jgi:hypothetical protein